VKAGRFALRAAMDSQQPEAKRDLETPSIPPIAQPRVGVRSYPKPPRLWLRFLLLCLKPEAWPAAAKYPLWVTLVPLLLAIVIGAGVFSVATSTNTMKNFDGFAKSYDAHYPEIDLDSEGVVSVKDPARQPLEFGNAESRIIVDTTGKTTPETVKDSNFMLITSRQIFRRAGDHDFDAITIKDSAARFLPEKGAVVRMNGTTLQSFLADNHAGMFSTVAILTFAVKLLMESLWVAATMFLIFPAVTIGAAAGSPRLFIPRRAAYRIAAAVLVPLILLSDFTSAAGYSVAGVVGGQNALIFWFFFAAALAFWAGHMAKAMFIPKPVRRRTT
jgi:hypothetical protein